jgi:hypothetical protein
MLASFCGINLLVLAGSASSPFPPRCKSRPVPVLERRPAKLAVKNTVMANGTREKVVGGIGAAANSRGA